MSIAEQIMLGTQQTNVLAQNLSVLGQQVGQQLAMREYQKQYQAALPVIENAMRSATAKIKAGDYTGGYAEAVSGLPLMSQNPLIAQASNSYLKSIGQVAEFQQNQMWNDLQRSRMGGPTSRTTLPGMRVPTAQELSDPNYTPDETVVDTTVTDVTGGRDMEPRFVGEDNTQGTPEQRAAQRAADQEFRTYQDADRAVELPVDGEGVSFGFGPVSGGAESFIPLSELTVPSTPPKKEDIKAVTDFRAKNPEQQDAQQQKITVSENQIPKDSMVVSFGDIPGIPFGGIAGKNKTMVEAKEKFTPGRREAERTIKEVGDFDAFTNNATVIGTRISNNRTLMDLFTAANGNWNNVQTAQEADAEGKPVGVAYVNGKKYETPLTTVQVEKDTLPEAFGELQMIEFVKNIVPLADKNGWKLIGQEAPAAAPAGGAKKLSLEEIALGGAAPAPTAAPAAAKPQPEKLSTDNPFAQAVSEKQTQKAAAAKQSIATQKATQQKKIQDSISELENKLKILTAVGQRNPEILPDYLRRKMGAYMNATPSRNAKDFEDTKKEIEKLRAKLKSL